MVRPVTSDASDPERPGVCLWCGRGFSPRRNGGKPQAFCRPACRREFDTAGRRWMAEAIASRRLTVEALRNGLVTTRALVSAAPSTVPVGQRLAPIALYADSPYTVQQHLEAAMARAI